MFDFDVGDIGFLRSDLYYDPSFQSLNVGYAKTAFYRMSKLGGLYIKVKIIDIQIGSLIAPPVTELATVVPADESTISYAWFIDANEVIDNYVPIQLSRHNPVASGSRRQSERQR